MTQIDILQHRITAALDRVAQGVGRMEEHAMQAAAVSESTAADPEELSQLRAALEDEKLANAQLEERVRKLHVTHRAELAAAAEQGAQTPDAVQPGPDLAALDQELQQLRLSNEMLRSTNAELREALAQHVGEPHLINKAMLAELEALRAARSVEVAETRAIVAALTPLLEAASDAPENQPAPQSQEAE